jgi:dephospho-CoA kinase
VTKIIGLTGGIGSGKTTIAKIFEAEGIPVYIADEEAKKLMRLPDTIRKVVSVFGEEILKDGFIDNKKLSAVVFNNPERLQELNKVIHPLVKKHFDLWVTKASNNIVIKETAILFESNSYKYCDKIITVTASEETRIRRVIARDNCTREQVLARMNHQISDEIKIAKSDYVITNENLDVAKKQCYEILKILKNL